MKFKIDENLPAAFAAELRGAGHEADTVREEKLEGASDDVVLAACDRESRVLVTEDLDFANVVAYPPDRHRASSSCARGSRAWARCGHSAGLCCRT